MRITSICAPAKTRALSFLFALQWACFAHAAPVPPDAGQTIRELQQRPEINGPESVPLFQPENEEPAKKYTSNNDVIIPVKGIHISGNTVFSEKVLESLVSNLMGDHTLQELEAGIERITNWYHEHGYVVAKAYLPPQDIKDGVININVLEGTFGEKHINNQSRLSDEFVYRYLREIKNGEALQAKPVDRALLLLSDTPGVDRARAALQPGASVGSADLMIDLQASSPYTANIELDNFGNYYTGVNRLGAVVALNSPLKLGDQFSVRAITGDQSMNYARYSYQLPFGGSGLRVGLAYTDTLYRLGQEFASLQAHGSATSDSLYALYPFLRSQSDNLSGTLIWERKKLNDRYDSTNTASDKQVQVTSLGLNGNFQGTLGGNSINSYDLTLALGKLNMDGLSLTRDALLPASAQSNGVFMRLTYNLNRIQSLSERNTLSIAMSGQQTNKNLNSSEQFSLGGTNGVRAYPQGEGSGDEGWIANVELHHDFMETVQGMLFYDIGSVKINYSPYAATANTRTISGVGFGANFSLAGVKIKTNLAWRASGGLPTSEPVSLSVGPRIWVQAGKQF